MADERDLEAMRIAEAALPGWKAVGVTGIGGPGGDAAPHPAAEAVMPDTEALKARYASGATVGVEFREGPMGKVQAHRPGEDDPEWSQG